MRPLLPALLCLVHLPRPAPALLTDQAQLKLKILELQGFSPTSQQSESTEQAQTIAESEIPTKTDDDKTSRLKVENEAVFNRPGFVDLYGLYGSKRGPQPTLAKVTKVEETKHCKHL